MLFFASVPRAEARRPAGPPADAATCAEARMVNGGHLMQRVLRCHAAAAAAGRRVARPCIRRAVIQFAKALKRVDRPGTCVRASEAAFALVQFGGFAEAAAAGLRPARNPSRCVSVKLRVTGAAAAQVLAATARSGRDLDMGALASSVGSTGAALEAAFAVVELRGHCQTAGDFSAVWLLLQTVAGLAGPLQGRVELVKVMQFPPDARADVVANRATLEGQGAMVAADGSSLTGPAEGAAGWIATVGDQAVRLDATGGFLLALPVGEPFEGRLYHPADRLNPVARFFVVELAGPTTSAPTPITLEVRTGGACGMNRDPADDPPSCHAPGSAAITPRLAFHELARLNPDTTLFPPKVNGDLGTYPSSDPAATQVACLDYNGFVQTGERGDGSIKGAIAYPGSTCQMQVDLGCCDNEAATIRRHLLSLVDEYTFPILHCPDNHKGERFCQSVTKGDLAVRVKGKVGRQDDGGTLEFTLQPAENVPFEVHDNGCYGETHVSPGFFNDGGGVLVGPLFDGETLRHYDASLYIADAPLMYLSNFDCPAGGGTDKYDFEADGSEVTVIFHCTPTTTTTTTCPGFQFSCASTTSTTVP
ncbi:MAG TPA: hypothetical protein VEM57_00965 [Candidatus Binatus sp.]|nr:hypothetical protein [Candidatus Binatus sp.]